MPPLAHCDDDPMGCHRNGAWKMTTAMEKLATMVATVSTAVKAHTVVGHLRPDIECCLGLFSLRHIPIFRNAFGVQDGAKLKFIAAGPLRKDDWKALNLTRKPTGLDLEKLGYRFFDCGGGELDQHGKLEVLQQQMASVDLMVVLSGATDSPEYLSTLRFIFELVSKNDLTAEDIVQDLDYRKAEWPHTQRTLRNFNTALNLLHPNRPDVVVQVMDIAFMGLITYAEAQAKVVGGSPDATLANLDEKTAVKIARSAFLMPNIIEGLKNLGETTHANFVREVKQAFDLYEGEWADAERDYWNTSKTQVYSGIQMRFVDQETKEVFFRPVTVAFTISKSERIGALCRRGNWSENRGESREDMVHEARRGADIIVHFQEGNQRKFTISTKDISLREVAAALRAADAVAKGLRGLTPLQVRDSLSVPGHVAINGAQMLYLAEFEKAFGHLRSNPHSEPTALSKDAIKEIVYHVLAEGLTRDHVCAILDGCYQR